VQAAAVAALAQQVAMAQQTMVVQAAMDLHHRSQDRQSHTLAAVVEPLQRAVAVRVAQAAAEQLTES
jgi:hypothetical protein